MRSPDATPLIERNGCIQHDTEFVAKVRRVIVSEYSSMATIRVGR